jgi:hypothetical protein
MCAGRMTAASAHGYIAVSRGQLWHRRPVRRIEAHLDPSFTTESPSAFQTSCHWRDARGWVKLPARITAPMIANGLVRGVLPALGQLQTPATIPHSDRLSKEFRHRRSGLPVRVIRPEHGWMFAVCQWWGLAADVTVTVAVSSAQVVRWQAEPDRRVPRPEDRKRRGSMNDGGRRPSDPESLPGVLTTLAERYLAWP